MTDPSPERSRALSCGTPTPAGRRMAGLVVAGVLGASLTPGLAAPTNAAPAAAPAGATGACRIGVAAAADADLITVHRLDVTALGIAHPTMAGVRLLSTRAGIAGGGTPKAAAFATYLTAGVIDERLRATALTADAEQYAPPANDAPDVLATPAVALGSLRLGTGRLAAHATLTDGRRCATTTGPAATAASRLQSADLLAAGDRSLADFGAVSTGSATNLVRTGNRSATLAVSSARIEDFTLLGGGSAPVTVHLTSQPVLRATAGGSRQDSSVRYTAPVMHVSVPGVGIRRVQGKTGRLDLAMPVDPASAAAAGALAREEGMPLLAPDALPQLLRALGSSPSAVGEVDGLAGASSESGAPQSRIAVIRLSIGALTEEITDAGVHAKAAAVRLQLTLRSCGSDGYGGKDDRETPLADIEIGVLEAAASAPAGSDPGDAGPGDGGGGGNGGGPGTGDGGTGGGAGTGDGGTGGGSDPTTGGTGGQPTGGGGPSGADASDDPAGGPRPTAAGANLPLTGNRLALIAGIGTLLVLGGRLVMLLARRRARTPNPPL